MISANDNPWSKKFKQQEDYKARKDALEAVIKKAQALIADEKFIEYKNLYKQYHATEMENLMMLSEQDPIKYAFKVRQIIDTLKAYRLLISAVERDASIQMGGVSK